MPRGNSIKPVDCLACGRRHLHQQHHYDSATHNQIRTTDGDTGHVFALRRLHTGGLRLAGHFMVLRLLQRCGVRWKVFRNTLCQCVVIVDDVKWVVHASRSCFYQQIWRQLLAEGPVPASCSCAAEQSQPAERDLHPQSALSNGAHIITHMYSTSCNSTPFPAFPLLSAHRLAYQRRRRCHATCALRSGRFANGTLVYLFRSRGLKLRVSIPQIYRGS